jgi:indolepyruvate ferredoxin oxidoreductase
MDASATVDVGSDRISITLPTDFDMPPDGLHIRWPDSSLDQERRLRHHKLEAAKAFARANPFDRIALDSAPDNFLDNSRPRIGIATTGKSYWGGPGRKGLQDRADLAAGARRSAPLRRWPGRNLCH